MKLSRHADLRPDVLSRRADDTRGDEHCSSTDGQRVVLLNMCVC